MNVDQYLDNKQKQIAVEILKEIRTRLKFLLDVRLDYHALDRGSVTLSGGESQRIRLATQIGSQLVNVLYILDEPSIGLHQRDNQRLIHSLKELRDIGNSVIVVEHDKDMMMAADYVIDMGPKAGRLGGEVVFAGTPKEMLETHTLTSQYLNGEREIEIPKKRREGNGQAFGCVHVLSPSIFRYMEDERWTGKFSIIPFYVDICPKARIQGFPIDSENWFDVGKPETLAKAEAYYASL